MQGARYGRCLSPGQGVFLVKARRCLRTEPVGLGSSTHAHGEGLALECVGVRRICAGFLGGVMPW